VDADTNVQKFGAVIKSPKSGFPIQNPYVGIGNTALDQMRKFLTEFGMTPASRSRIQVTHTDAKDSFQEFMKGLGAEDVATNVD
jgi:P27 family predicted phage terminase small subunit